MFNTISRVLSFLHCCMLWVVCVIRRKKLLDQGFRMTDEFEEQVAKYLVIMVRSVVMESIRKNWISLSNDQVYFVDEAARRNVNRSCVEAWNYLPDDGREVVDKWWVSVGPFNYAKEWSFVWDKMLEHIVKVNSE